MSNWRKESDSEIAFFTKSKGAHLKPYRVLGYELIEEALREMKPRQKLYELVKAEMKRRNRWKAIARGLPMRRGSDSRRHK